MLIRSPRQTARDIDQWEIDEARDRALSLTARMGDLERRALAALASFAKCDGAFYVGVSWGKDSVAVAHLAWRLGLTCSLAWFPAGRIENPDCQLVRDAFLARWPMRYLEIEAGPTGPIDSPFGHDGAQPEFERASRAVGRRYVSGVRAAESGVRKLRMRTWGESSPNTCAPIGWWPTSYVFAYLAKYELPVHPIYGCTGGGLYERDRLRVGTVGGQGGIGFGRREHERRYYPEMFRALKDLT